MNITSQDPGFGTKEGVHEPTTADLVVSDMLPIFIFCFIILIFPVWYRAREEGQCDGLFDTLTCLRKKEQSTIKDGVNKLGKELKNEYLYGLEGAIEELDPQELNEMIYYQSILKARSEDKLKRARSRDSSIQSFDPANCGTPANLHNTKVPIPTIMSERDSKSDSLLN